VHFTDATAEQKAELDRALEEKQVAVQIETKETV